MFNERIICGLDLGVQRIKAGVLKLREGHYPDLIGVCENVVYGYKNCSVTDLGELSECIHSMINQLSKKTGYRIKDVQLGISSDLVELREVNTVIPLVDKGNKVIARRDIHRVNNQARMLGVNMEEEILHNVSQYYRIDDVNFARNPLGLYGRKLGVYSHLLVTQSNRLQNILKAIHQAGYDTSNVFLSSYAASSVVLDEQDKYDGIALVDIGAAQTTLLVFKEKQLCLFKKIQIGGNHFTQQIAHHLNLAVDLADEIKRSYASANHNEDHSNEEILVKKDSTYFPIKKEEINKSIQVVINRLVHSLNSLIETSGFADRLNTGIVVIGGGSLLPGLIEKIGQGTRLRVQIGHLKLDSVKRLSNSALFSAVIGIAYMSYLATKKNQNTDEEPTSWLRSLSSRLCEIYQEYF